MRREADAVADKIRVARDRARVMEAEEDAASFRERLDAATRANESLIAEKTSLETTVTSQASRIDRMPTQAEARKRALRAAEREFRESEAQEEERDYLSFLKTSGQVPAEHPPQEDFNKFLEASNQLTPRALRAAELRNLELVMEKAVTKLTKFKRA